MRMTKKSYMVPETAFEQFLKPLGGILSGSDPTNPGGNGSNDPGIGGTPGAPGRKPF